MEVQDLLVAIVAVVVGAALLLAGYRYALILLPIWGFFAGFVIGAELLQSFFGDGFLATTTSWVVGAIVGLAFAVLSYLFWYLAVVILFASVGYWFGWGLMTLIGFQPDAFFAVLVGLLFGGAFAVAAFVTGVPFAALVVITAIAGAHAVVAGALVLFQIMPAEAFGSGLARAIIELNPGWWLVSFGLAVFGVLAQMKSIGEFVLEPPANRI